MSMSTVESASRSVPVDRRLKDLNEALSEGKGISFGVISVG